MARWFRFEKLVSLVNTLEMRRQAQRRRRFRFHAQVASFAHNFFSPFGAGNRLSVAQFPGDKSLG